MTTASAEQAMPVVRALIARGLTISAAESLTGGLLLAALTSVPGASAVVRGGSVVYMTDTKSGVLGVSAELLAERGPVDADVARAMAASARELWGADLGVATTGVAGPDPQGGHPVGEVHLALAHSAGVTHEQLDLGHAGSRAHIRELTVQRALALVAAQVDRRGGL